MAGTRRLGRIPRALGTHQVGEPDSPPDAMNSLSSSSDPNLKVPVRRLGLDRAVREHHVAVAAGIVGADHRRPRSRRADGGAEGADGASSGLSVPNPASAARSPASRAPIRAWRSPGSRRPRRHPSSRPVLENILRRRRAPARATRREAASGTDPRVRSPAVGPSARSPSSSRSHARPVPRRRAGVGPAVPSRKAARAAASAFSSPRSFSAAPPTSSPEAASETGSTTGDGGSGSSAPRARSRRISRFELHPGKSADHRHQSEEDRSAGGRDAAGDHHRPAAFEQHDVPAEDHGEEAARHHRKAEDEKRDDHADPVTHTRRRGFYGSLFS